LQTYRKTYNDARSKNQNLKPCPSDKPYYNGSICIKCTSERPLFNIESGKCLKCHDGTFFDKNQQACVRDGAASRI
jgi:hypothetical protein